MSSTGSLVVHVFLSTAQIPIHNATVILSKPSEDGRQTLVAIQNTDESGIAGPFTLNAPNASESTSPGHNATAFSSYTLLIEHPDYQLARFDNLQIFPGVETVQNVPLIPLSEFGQQEADSTIVTPQPL